MNKSFFASLLLALALFMPSALLDAVDLNTADAKAIAKELNGVGEKKAKAIVDYRKKSGKFKTLDDVLKVKGIGYKTLEKNQKNILINGKPGKLTPQKTSASTKSKKSSTSSDKSKSSAKDSKQSK